MRYMKPHLMEQPLSNYQQWLPVKCFYTLLTHKCSLLIFPVWKKETYMYFKKTDIQL